MDNQRIDNVDIDPITQKNSSSFQFHRDNQQIYRKNVLEGELDIGSSQACAIIKENAWMSVDRGAIKRENEKEQTKKVIDRTIKRCHTETNCIQQDQSTKIIPSMPQIQDYQSNLPLNKNCLLTDRSSVLDNSMRWRTPLNLYHNLEQQERMLKLIEQKALMLKKKQKKERAMLKQFKKSKQVLSVVDKSRIQSGNNQTSMNSFRTQNKIKGHKRVNSGVVVAPAIEIDHEHIRKYQLLLQKCKKYQQKNEKLNADVQKMQKLKQQNKNIYQQKILNLNSKLQESIIQNQENQRKYAENLTNLNIQLRDRIKQTDDKQFKWLQQIAQLSQQLNNQLKQNAKKQQLVQQLTKIIKIQKLSDQSQKEQANKLNKCIDDLIKQKTETLEMHNQLVAAANVKHNQLVEASQLKIVIIKQQLQKRNQTYHKEVNKINQELKQLKQSLKTTKQSLEQQKHKNIQLSKSLNKNATLFKQIIESKIILSQQYQNQQRTNTELKDKIKQSLIQNQTMYSDYQAQLNKQKQKYNEAIRSYKLKEKQNYEAKKTLEKTCAQLTEDKRKIQQLYLKEVNSYKSQSQNYKKIQAEIVKLKQQLKNNDYTYKKQNQLLKNTINQSKIKIKSLEESIKQNDMQINKNIQKLKTYECQKLKQTLDSQLTNSQLRQQIQSQLLTSKIIESQLHQKEMQLSLKAQELSEVIIKLKQLERGCAEEIHEIKETLNKKINQNNKITQQNQEKNKNIKVLQESLKNAEQHIKKIENKYQSVCKELTQKNLASDFIWMQLQQKKGTIKMLQTRLNEQKASRVDKNSSHEYDCHTSQKSSDHQSPTKGENNPHYIKKQMRRILSSSTIKELQEEIKQIKDLIDCQESIECQDKENQQSSLPLCLVTNMNSQPDSIMNSLAQSNIQQRQHCRESLQIMQIGNKLYELQKQKQQQIQQIQKKNINIMLHHSLSDALSQSQQNDQIIQMISNTNSNTSKMQSSLGAFSEYSRIKSTQSEVTHRQLQDTYKNKIKNTKLMAKLNKLKKK